MNNNYKNKIKEIITESLKGSVMTYEGMNSECILAQGASFDKIQQCNLYFNNTLPQDYFDFLKQYDGGIFYKIEDFAGYKLLGTHNIITENEIYKQMFDRDWDKTIILFCANIGDNDYLGFKVKEDGTYEIIDCFMETMPSEWQSINFSFDNFLCELINQKGRKFWLDNL